MKRFLIILCLFIGIAAYNIYTPSREEVFAQDWYIHDVQKKLVKKRCAGLLVSIFFGGCSYNALYSLYKHFEERR